MRLDYSILWFEDVGSFCDSKIPDIKDLLDEKGFRLEVVRRDGKKDFKKFILDPKFDLFLIDYNLMNDREGVEIVEEIKRHDVYTELIFYSGDGPKVLRDLLHEKGIDGIFCLDRNDPDFEEKVRSIIHITIKKVEDINNLRGLVMAGVGDCDLHLQDTIRARYDQLDQEGKIAFVGKIKAKITSAHEQPQKDLQEALDKEDLDALLKTTICSSGTLTKVLLSIMKPFKSQDHIKPLRDKLVNYDKEVLKPRNELAHCREGERDGEPVLITLEGEKKYGEKEFTTVRKDLIDHTSNLEEIKILVEEKKLT